MMRHPLTATDSGDIALLNFLMELCPKEQWFDIDGEGGSVAHCCANAGVSGAQLAHDIRELNHPNRAGFTPFMIGVMNNHPHIAEFYNEFSSEMHRRAFSGELQEGEVSAEEAACTDAVGHRPITYAVAAGREENVKALLPFSLDKEALKGLIWTAAFNQHTHLVELLFQEYKGESSELFSLNSSEENDTKLALKGLEKKCSDKRKLTSVLNLLVPNDDPGLADSLTRVALLNRCSSVGRWLVSSRLGRDQVNGTKRLMGIFRNCYNHPQFGQMIPGEMSHLEFLVDQVSSGPASADLVPQLIEFAKEKKDLIMLDMIFQKNPSLAIPEERKQIVGIKRLFSKNVADILSQRVITLNQVTMLNVFCEKLAQGEREVQFLLVDLWRVYHAINDKEIKEIEVQELVNLMERLISKLKDEVVLNQQNNLLFQVLLLTGRCVEAVKKNVKEGGRAAEAVNQCIRIAAATLVKGQKEFPLDENKMLDRVAAKHADMATSIALLRLRYLPTNLIDDRLLSYLLDNLKVLKDLQRQFTKEYQAGHVQRSEIFSLTTHLSLFYSFILKMQADFFSFLSGDSVVVNDYARFKKLQTVRELALPLVEFFENICFADDFYRKIRDKIASIHSSQRFDLQMGFTQLERKVLSAIPDDDNKASAVVSRPVSWSRFGGSGTSIELSMIQSLLMWAIKENARDLLPTLIPHIESDFVLNCDGAKTTLYHRLAVYSDLDTVTAFISLCPVDDLKAALSVKDKRGFTPFLYAVQSGHAAVVDWFVSKKYDKFATPLHRQAYEGSLPEAIKKEDVLAADELGVLPLGYAVSGGSVKAVEQLHALTPAQHINPIELLKRAIDAKRVALFKFIVPKINFVTLVKLALDILKYIQTQLYPRHLEGMRAFFNAIPNDDRVDLHEMSILNAATAGLDKLFFDLLELSNNEREMIIAACAKILFEPEMLDHVKTNFIIEILNRYSTRFNIPDLMVAFEKFDKHATGPVRLAKILDEFTKNQSTHHSLSPTDTCLSLLDKLIQICLEGGGVDKTRVRKLAERFNGLEKSVKDNLMKRMVIKLVIAIGGGNAKNRRVENQRRLIQLWQKLIECFQVTKNEEQLLMFSSIAFSVGEPRSAVEVLPSKLDDDISILELHMVKLVLLFITRLNLQFPSEVGEFYRTTTLQYCNTLFFVDAALPFLQAEGVDSKLIDKLDRSLLSLREEIGKFSPSESRKMTEVECNKRMQQFANTVDLVTRMLVSFAKLKIKSSRDVLINTSLIIKSIIELFNAVMRKNNFELEAKELTALLDGVISEASSVEDQVASTLDQSLPEETKAESNKPPSANEKKDDEDDGYDNSKDRLYEIIPLPRSFKPSFKQKAEPLPRNVRFVISSPDTKPIKKIKSAPVSKSVPLPAPAKPAAPVVSKSVPLPASAKPAAQPRPVVRDAPVAVLSAPPVLHPPVTPQPVSHITQPVLPLIPSIRVLRLVPVLFPASQPQFFAHPPFQNMPAPLFELLPYIETRGAAASIPVLEELPVPLRALIFGGAVRDLIAFGVHTHDNDTDILTTFSEEDILKAFPNAVKHGSEDKVSYSIQWRGCEVDLVPVKPNKWRELLLGADYTVAGLAGHPMLNYIHDASGRGIADIKLKNLDLISSDPRQFVNRTEQLLRGLCFIAKYNMRPSDKMTLMVGKFKEENCEQIYYTHPDSIQILTKAYAKLLKACRRSFEMEVDACAEAHRLLQWCNLYEVCVARGIIIECSQSPKLGAQ